MPLTANVWKPKISIDESNIGHINLILEILGEAEKLSNLKELYPYFIEEFYTFRIAREMVSFKTSPVFKRGEVVKGITATLSFWPEKKPGFGELLKQFFHISKGVRASFEMNKKDMISEMKKKKKAKNMTHHINNLNAKNKGGPNATASQTPMKIIEILNTEIMENKIDIRY